MKLIQLILVPLIALLVAIYLGRFRSLLTDRIIVVALGAIGVMLIINPSLSDKLAAFVGVGRGVDLVMYLALTGLGFVSLLLYSKVRSLEQKLTEVARQEAVYHAKIGRSSS